MIENYQEEKELQQAETEAFSFATIDEVHADGVTLIFPGDEAPANKHHKCNVGVVFKKGQRVYLQKDHGEYVVLFPIGNPITKLNADTAASATNAVTSAKSATADKLASERKIQLTGAVTGEINFDGSKNVAIPTTLSSVTNFTTTNLTATTLKLNGVTITRKQAPYALSTNADLSASIRYTNDLRDVLISAGLLKA